MINDYNRQIGLSTGHYVYIGSETSKYLMFSVSCLILSAVRKYQLLRDLVCKKFVISFRRMIAMYGFSIIYNNMILLYIQYTTS